MKQHHNHLFTDMTNDFAYYHDYEYIDFLGE